MLAKKISEKIEVPEGVQASVQDNLVTVKGSKGELSRSFASKQIVISVEDGSVVLTAGKPSQREKRMVGTFSSHIKNMMKGVSEGHIYKLKVCSGHFPMTVESKNNEIVVKNFLGEKNPRTLKFSADVKVNVNGPDIVVEGINKELVSQTAANIEQLTRITNKDRRIFQDGIYLTEKDGKQL